MSVINLDSENLQLDWISFNLEGLIDPKIIAGRLLKYFTPHVLMDDLPSIGYHGFKKSIRFLSINTQDQKVTGLELELFSLVKMLVTFINFSKLENLIGVFSSSSGIL
jgi:hypothetical protein